jgi:GNAT superfamily N-acetyltransferase
MGAEGGVVIYPPSVEVAIRDGSGEDRDALRQVFIEAAQAAWSHILPESAFAQMSLPDRWLSGSGVHLLVAESAGRVVGFVCVRKSHDDDAGPDVGEVDAFYTHPSVWGHGVGRALLSAAIERLQASGFTQATLWTEHRNDRPLRFYRAAGWTPDGAEKRRTYHGTELVELRQRLSLPGVIR